MVLDLISVIKYENDAADDGRAVEEKLFATSHVEEIVSIKELSS